MTLASWWRTDTLPHLPALPGFQATVASDDKELAHLNGLTVREVQARRQAGHRPYVGSMDGTPVTYGWVATREATIGELRLRFQLLPGDRYLWDFATLPAWQGRGLYPRLLGAILAAESVTAERAWIIHAPENLPSGAGIQKAGFIPVGRLSFGAGGGVALTPMGSLDRARAGAHLLGVALVAESLRPCWRCEAAAAEAEACASTAPGVSSDACVCAIQPRPARQSAA
jgi:hypothetical protein